MRIFPGLIRVRPVNRRRSLRRMRRRIDAWQSGELDEDAIFGGVALRESKIWLVV